MPQPNLTQFEDHPGDHKNLIRAMTQVCTMEQIAKITQMVLDAREPTDPVDRVRSRLRRAAPVLRSIYPK